MSSCGWRCGYLIIDGIGRLKLVRVCFFFKYVVYVLFMCINNSTKMGKKPNNIVKFE